ncbi:hypothetical protein OVA29_03060 [Exiguobacterium sp. SL14]|nr:hypothetical protein [Exiguobacterium sp. SL14]MCY1689915.1 hypothetical protein [Exiguobacterium sp. SL14]
METMFGVGMVADGLRALSLRIATSIGFKMNKKLFAQGVGKMIPLVGGTISGGFALIALQQMRGRLQKELALSVDCTSQ